MGESTRFYLSILYIGFLFLDPPSCEDPAPFNSLHWIQGREDEVAVHRATESFQFFTLDSSGFKGAHVYIPLKNPVQCFQFFTLDSLPMKVRRIKRGEFAFNSLHWILSLIFDWVL